MDETEHCQDEEATGSVVATMGQTFRVPNDAIKLWQSCMYCIGVRCYQDADRDGLSNELRRGAALMGDRMMMARSYASDFMSWAIHEGHFDRNSIVSPLNYDNEKIVLAVLDWFVRGAPAPAPCVKCGTQMRHVRAKDSCSKASARRVDMAVCNACGEKQDGATLPKPIIDRHPLVGGRR